jgi:hypothetical protein
MLSDFIAARRIDPARLLIVLAVPFAAALALAAAAAGLGAVGDGGAVAFLFEAEKVCFLAVAMAHLSGALAERLPGTFLGLGLREEAVDPARFWAVFPNHADGAVLSLASALACALAA